MKKLLIVWLFKKRVRLYIDSNIKDKDEDFTGYLYDLLCKDEVRMIGSKDALIGYWDLDIEMNRQIQAELKQYVRD